MKYFSDNVFGNNVRFNVHARKHVKMSYDDFLII